MVTTLILAIVVIVIGALAAFLLSRAPFMTPEYKTWANWLILAVVVVIVAVLLLSLLGIRLG